MSQRVVLVLPSVVLATAALMGVTSCRDGAPENARSASSDARPFADLKPAAKPSAGDVSQADQAIIERFCGTCHKLPPPDVEPRRLWAEKIKEMYGYADSGRAWPDTQMPRQADAVRYFASRAPVELELPEDAMDSPPSPLRFRRQLVNIEGMPPEPAIASVRLVHLNDSGPRQLLVCDMRHGIVALCELPFKSSALSDVARRGVRSERSPLTLQARVIAQLRNPSRTHVVDLDQDGIRDILVADLGVFWNEDTRDGRVVWLRGRADGGFDSVVLLDNVSRVNEIRTADFDHDGDLDLVVAIFGNFATGMIAYLENYTEDYDEPDFEPSSLDGHTGTSDVPVVDLNGDGHPDFVALQSQESEHVLAFLNNGRGRFSSQPIFEAPHPRWGSTGIELVDLDGDGDTDLLWNHGDAVQMPPVLRPYHGISWLENRGEFPFTYHRLAHMPAAHTSIPADLDGDGDLDIVASAFLPAFNPTWPHAGRLDTVIWLEQTSPGIYKRYRIEAGFALHPCAEVGDWDGDGDRDIILGNFVLHPFGTDMEQCSLTVWEREESEELIHP